ncbi:MAG: hypothetical protein CL908_24110 [Deltaproteobacteria bacterium]|jgi:copper(I)-binding protein|nr:hypothetical protein [Deltaproteobacteria bacterium]
MLRSTQFLALMTTIALLFGSASAGARGETEEAESTDLKVVNGWVAMPMWDGDEPPAYFTIMNQGPARRRIVGASSPHCERMEVRRSALIGETMASEELDGFDVPGGGGAVAFVPRGLFLRMISPKPLAEGDPLTIVLEFANGEKLPFDAIVKESAR